MDFFFFYFWFPWVSFFNLNWFIQILFIYNFLLFMSSTNVFLGLVYFFFLIILFSTSLSLFQMELFSGFLIVIEFTVIFIFLVFLFFLNVENNNFKVNLWYSYFFLYFFLYFIVNVIINLTDFFFFYLNNSNFFIFENYFEANNNFNMNDFIAIFLNYYSFNVISFIIICTLLLIGSIICVNLNKINYFFKNIEIFRKKKKINIGSFFFFRRQNLINQANFNSNIRIIKKK